MMVSKKFIGNFEELMGELSELGYQHTWGVMNAADYGVAQSRKRLFVISKLGGVPPELPKPFPLTKCLRDYLEPEPVDPSYYLSEDRIKGLVWSNQKEEEAGNNFRFQPTTGGDRLYGDLSRWTTQDGQLPPSIRHGVEMMLRARASKSLWRPFGFLKRPSLSMGLRS